MTPASLLAARFQSKVQIATNGCWEWTASKRPNGYGQIGLNGKPAYAHRVSWQIHHGQIPQGMYVCHKCDNKKCVNPDHLFLGTPTDNIRDAMQKGLTRHPGAQGERNAKAKISEADVREIRALRSVGTQVKTIGARFGLTPSTIHRIVTRRYWGLVE